MQRRRMNRRAPPPYLTASALATTHCAPYPARAPPPAPSRAARGWLNRSAACFLARHCPAAGRARASHSRVACSCMRRHVPVALCIEPRCDAAPRCEAPLRGALEAQGAARAALPRQKPQRPRQRPQPRRPNEPRSRAAATFQRRPRAVPSRFCTLRPTPPLPAPLARYVLPPPPPTRQAPRNPVCPRPRQRQTQCSPAAPRGRARAARHSPERPGTRT